MIFSTKQLCRLFVFTFFISFVSSEIAAQTSPCGCWVPIDRHRLVMNVNVSPNVHAYGEWLPPDYNPGSSKKHPLIIHLHGNGAVAAPNVGNDPYYLCMALCDGLPMRMEDSNQYNGAIPVDRYHTVNGTTYTYIVLTYNYEAGANWQDVQAMINYSIANYPKVDRSRIYLAGLSRGSGLITDYMSSSLANARRVAAVVPFATCTGPNANGASNMAYAPARYWGIAPVSDNVCGGSASQSLGWANGINAANPSNPMGKATITPVYNSGFSHDIARVWDSDWKENGLTVLQWMLQYTSAAGGALPATLGKYDVYLRDKKVNVDWTTTVESNTNYFSIERAGADMQFKEIGRINAAGNSTISKTYAFSDLQPLKGNSFYRLALMNRDGVAEYYDTKKISARQFGIALSISPVPVQKTLQLSFDLEQAQRLSITVRDVNGRSMGSWNVGFNSGYNNFPINTEALSPGVYYLITQGDSFSETKKFIKQ